MIEDDFLIYSELEEKLARAICISEDCDPEKETTGMGHRLPKDLKCKLWQVRLPQARIAISIISVNK